MSPPVDEEFSETSAGAAAAVAAVAGFPSLPAPGKEPDRTGVAEGGILLVLLGVVDLRLATLLLLEETVEDRNRPRASRG